MMRAAFCTVAVALAWFGAAISAWAQDGDAQLAQRLTLNSAAVLRSFQLRAAEDQARIYRELSQRDSELARSLANERLAANARESLRVELAGVTAERTRLSDQLAARDLEFAAERAALLEQLTGIVSQASPEKRAALERFAAGDRIDAYAVIEEMTLAENRARERAAIAVSVANLRSLEPLLRDMLGRGEKTLADFVSHYQAILAIDPVNVEAVSQQVEILILMGRGAEALAAADRAIADIDDPWDRLRLESAVLSARLEVAPIASALAGIMAAGDAISAERGPLGSWPAEERGAYCNGMKPLMSESALLRLYPRVLQLASVCLMHLPDLGGRGLGFATGVLDAVARAQMAVRRYDESTLFIDTYAQVLDQSAVLRNAPVIRASGTHFLNLLYAMRERGFGRLASALEYQRRSGAAIEQARPVFTEDQNRRFTASLEAWRVQLLVEEEQYQQARAAIEALIEAPQQVTREIVASDPDSWTFRMQKLNLLAELALELEDFAAARQAIDRSGTIMTLLQGTDFPPPVAETYLRTEAFICTSLSAALLMTRVRIAEGDLARAEALTGFPGFSSTLQPRELYESCHPTFRTDGLLLLAGVAAQGGNPALARERLDQALASARDYAAREPSAFVWTTTRILAEFRLAQLANDGAGATGLREQVMALERAGTPPLRGRLRAHLMAWRPDRPIVWH